MNPPAARCTPFRALPWSAKAVVLGLGCAAAAFSAVAYPVWRTDDNMVHGFLVPFLALILVSEVRREPRPRFVGSARLVSAVVPALLALSALTAAASMVYAVEFTWTHTMAEFLLGCTLALLLAAGWVSLSDRRVGFVPVGWPAAVLVLLWVLAAPPPPGTYARIAFHLQGLVIHGVVGLLSALGIAAHQDGNVIELARTSVGVSEACSGVRSLISCTVAGLFLSALVVRTMARRVLVVALAPLIGLGMNFVRSALLTLLANSGVDIGGAWHDFTGASIILVTSLLVALLAFTLHRGEAPARDPGAAPAAQVPAAATAPLACVLGFLVVGACLAAVSVERTLDLRGGGGREPSLQAIIPPPPPGWVTREASDLDRYSSILQTHSMVQREYEQGPSADPVRIVVYLAYWKPGQASVSQVDEHTPDACWPGTGWEPRPLPSGRVRPRVEGRLLPVAERRLFVKDSVATHVWFWHLYGGHPIVYENPYSSLRLLASGWSRGFEPPGEQLYVCVSSNRDWESISDSVVIRELSKRLKPFGL